MSATLVPQTDVKVRESDDLASVLRQVTAQKPNAPEKPVAPRNTVAVSEDALKAIEAFSGLLGTVEVPSGGGPLTAQQELDLMRLADAAKKVDSAVKAAVGEIKEAVFSDFDREVEKLYGVGYGEAPFDIKTENDGTWHYLVTGETVVPEYERHRFTRELAEQAPVVSAKVLHQMMRDGKISRDFYLETTDHVDHPRVTNPGKLLAKIKSNPRYWLPKLQDAIVPGKVTASFHVRPKKKD